MAKLKINDIKRTGAELFDDSESFMNELVNDDLGQVLGGQVVNPDVIKTVVEPTEFSSIRTTIPYCNVGPFTPVIL